MVKVKILYSLHTVESAALEYNNIFLSFAMEYFFQIVSFKK